MVFAKPHHPACYLALLLFLVISPMARATAAPSAPPAEDRISLDFKDVELIDLIKTISELTGKNFLYDDNIKGKVTILSPESMNLEETYQLFLAALNAKGYTVVPSGAMEKIVLTRTVRQEGLPVHEVDQQGFSEQFITRLIRLDNLEAEHVAKSVLTPLMPPTGSIITHAPTNTLILTESAATIDRMVKILKKIDRADISGSLELLPLRHGNAEDLARICTAIIAKQRQQATARSDAPGQSTIIPYPRTNSLILLADDKDMAMIKKVVALLDQQTDRQQSHIQVYYLENADAELLAATLSQIISGVKTAPPDQTDKAVTEPASLTPDSVSITADKPTNALIINAQPNDYALLESIIKKLDIKRKQVYVEALILELSMDATLALGTSLQGAFEVGDDGVAFSSSNLNAGNASLTDFSGTNVPSLLGETIDGILMGGLFNPITVTGLDGSLVTVPAFSVLIDLSKKDSDINILSAPRLLTSDNEEAEIIVGSNIPIITDRLTDAGGAGLAQSVTIERQDVALTLRFTPQVTEGNLVRLNVFQEITDLASFSVGNVDQVGPTLTKRLLRNTVLAENGRTVVLGGLIGTNVQETVSKVPLLGDIPLLNFFFKHKRTTEQKTNLLVFITPTIINSPEDLAAVTSKHKNKTHDFLTDKTRTMLPADFLPPAQQSGPSSAVPADDEAGSSPGTRAE